MIMRTLADSAESIIYVLGEMGHTVAAFPATATKTSAPLATPVPFLPPSIPAAYTKFMDGAELVLNPATQEVYASNRLELHASKMNPTLAALAPADVAPGDAVAVYTTNSATGLDNDVKWVRTDCCCIRGMALSPDNKYVALAGMCKGGIAVYEVKAGGEWTRVGGLAIDNVTDFAWL